jgi:uncharacterized DUF497 family protein
MEVEWDEAKSARCREERGFSFAYAVRTFADPDRLIEPDTRFDYPKERFRLMVPIEGRIFVVVFTRRAERTRIISARQRSILCWKAQPP